MGIATMELVSVAKVSLELIARSLLAPTIVCLEVNVLTTPAFAPQDGHTSTAQSNFAPMIALEMVIARTEVVSAVPNSTDRTVLFLPVSITVLTTDFASMGPAGANQVLEERIAASKLAPTTVETLDGATTELVCATLNMPELIARFTKRTHMFQ